MWAWFPQGGSLTKPHLGPPHLPLPFHPDSGSLAQRAKGSLKTSEGTHWLPGGRSD